MGGTARRREPQQPGPQSQPGAHRGHEPARLAGQAEGLAQRLVQQRDRHPAHDRPQRGGRGRPGDAQRGLGDPPVGGVELEMIALVGRQQLEVAVVRARQVPDAHELAEPGREPRQGAGLDRVEGSPAELLDPADRPHDGGGEDVAELVVGDVVVPVDPVQPAQRGVGALGVDALDRGLLTDEQRVVVPLDAVVLELASPVEQPRDRRDAVVAEEGDAGALGVVTGELVAAGEPHDPVRVALRVERTDLPQDVVPPAGELGHATHSLTWAIVAAGSSVAGETWRLVTPASRKAAIRSLTYDAGPTRLPASSHSRGTFASASRLLPPRYRSWISLASCS